MLLIKKLAQNAITPTVAHSGEDIGFDLYACEDVVLLPKQVTKVKTGIAIEITPSSGALIMDRSSLGSKGIKVYGGVIDAGFRGEIVVMLGSLLNTTYEIKTGDKIAQLIPGFNAVVSSDVLEVDTLSYSNRDQKGWGSSGK